MYFTGFLYEIEEISPNIQIYWRYGFFGNIEYCIQINDGKEEIYSSKREAERRINYLLTQTLKINL